MFNFVVEISTRSIQRLSSELVVTLKMHFSSRTSTHQLSQRTKATKRRIWLVFPSEKEEPFLYLSHFILTLLRVETTDLFPPHVQYPNNYTLSFIFFPCLSIIGKSSNSISLSESNKPSRVQSSRQLNKNEDVTGLALRTLVKTSPYLTGLSF